MGSGPSSLDDESQARLSDQRERTLRRAAGALLDADVLLLCTGAGFSADSGLPVYKDIAEVEAYRGVSGQDFTYRDICNPAWLESFPDIFYGFWGQCFNDYRATEPHPGYAMVRRWRDERFAQSETGQQIRRKVLAGSATASKQGPGAFFVYTSNVDAHSFDHFDEFEVRECHGNVEHWQCGRELSPCCTRTWRAPLDFQFQVETGTMRAAKNPQATSPPVEAENKATAPSVNGNHKPVPGVARAGHVFAPFGPRRNRLSRLPQVTPEAVAGQWDNHPQCPHCGCKARPAVLMFQDANWVTDYEQEARWLSWLSAVESVALERARASSGARLRILVLEIGCGGNVRTVRETVESMSMRFSRVAGVTLVRVNPDHPFPDDPLTAIWNPHLDHLALNCQGLEALKGILRAVESGAAEHTVPLARRLCRFCEADDVSLHSADVSACSRCLGAMQAMVWRRLAKKATKDDKDKKAKAQAGGSNLRALAAEVLQLGEDHHDFLRYRAVRDFGRGPVFAPLGAPAFRSAGDRESLGARAGSASARMGGSAGERRPALVDVRGDEGEATRTPAAERRPSKLAPSAVSSATSAGEVSPKSRSGRTLRPPPYMEIGKHTLTWRNEDGSPSTSGGGKRSRMV